MESILFFNDEDCSTGNNASLCVSCKERKPTMIYMRYYKKKSSIFTLMNKHFYPFSSAPCESTLIWHLNSKNWNVALIH